MGVESILAALDWRSIGPTRGGRVVAVSGDPHQPGVFYFGSTGGGVWKTDDAGSTWQNISDGFFRRASVGAIAVAPSDPNVIYVGMGESTIRGNVSFGDGVYRSTDAGNTWQHMGLEATRHIGRVVVHPQDPDLVYVAAFGHAFGPSPERGVYRSWDGGKNWELVLFRSDRAGANFVEIDPTNPRNIYACFWEAERGPYYLNSGGPGSGIFRSQDSGETWEEITNRPGLPDGMKGKMEVAISPQPGRLWAIIEADIETKKNGVYRSDDGGDHWEQLSSDTNLTGRPWYFNHIRADPRDADTVWVLNFETWKSVDGGRTYRVIAGPHADYHDLWFDPVNTNRMILGGDGGGCVTWNGGQSWSTIYNQPTGEFYHVTVDNRHPYRVYGAQQDNTTMSTASQSDRDAIIMTDWYEIGGGESGYIAIRPDNPNIIFAGAQAGTLTRYDHERAQQLDIAVWPDGPRGHGAEGYRYRTNWTAPTVLSPHNPDVLYYGSNVVHRSTSDGRAWEVISPDLTRADPETMHASGGKITKDNSGAEVYATIFTIAPSPLDANVIWAGSDDGLVHITRDGGATWENINPPELPDWALISLIEASSHDAGTAYLAATRYKMDDPQPYIYKTTDYGKTWRKITNGIPADIYTRAVREDPTRRGLLYAATEFGLYVSFDDGENWRPLGGTSPENARYDLPVVPIHDMVIAGDNLVVCTHGRSFWILDDLTLVRQLAAEDVSAHPSYLFAPRDATRFKRMTGFGNNEIPGRNYIFVGGIVQTYITWTDRSGQKRQHFLDAGDNPADGVVVYYWLQDPPTQPITLTFADANGQVIRTLQSKAIDGDKSASAPNVPAVAGLNRFVWDMRYPDAVALEAKGGDQPRTAGPRVVPGQYEVRLTVGDTTQSQIFSITNDPRNEATDDDLRAQCDFLLQVRDKLSEINTAINQIRAIKEQASRWEKRIDTESTDVGTAARALHDRVSAIEQELIQVKANSPKDTLNFPVMLNSRLGRIANAASSADMRPTQQTYDAFEHIAARIDQQLAAFRTILETDVPAFNALVASADLSAIGVRA